MTFKTELNLPNFDKLTDGDTHYRSLKTFHIFEEIKKMTFYYLMPSDEFLRGAVRLMSDICHQE